MQRHILLHLIASHRIASHRIASHVGYEDFQTMIWQGLPNCEMKNYHKIGITITVGTYHQKGKLPYHEQGQNPNSQLSTVISAPFLPIEPKRS